MKISPSDLRWLGPAATGLALTLVSHAQVVNVTAALESTSVVAGASTVLHVYAQVVPTQQTNVNRIFSWYVDVVNTNGTAAVANYAAMIKPVSDKDPSTSSTGVSDGANRRAVYDTFLNLPGAGVNAPVELMAIPITGAKAGQARFLVRAGTGAGLSSDFLVAPLNGGAPLTGGSYSLADILLTVKPGPLNPRISLIVTNASGNAKGVTIQFPVTAGFSYTLQYQDQLASGTGWQALPGAPHNSGSGFDLSTSATRFYRLAIVPSSP